MSFVKNNFTYTLTVVLFCTLFLVNDEVGEVRTKDGVTRVDSHWIIYKKEWRKIYVIKNFRKLSDPE